MAEPWFKYPYLTNFYLRNKHYLAGGAGTLRLARVIGYIFLCFFTATL
jgi:hypothetical protein